MEVSTVPIARTAAPVPIRPGDAAALPTAASDRFIPTASPTVGSLSDVLVPRGGSPPVQDSWSRPLHVPGTHQVAVAPDGRRAFADSLDGTLSAFDPASGQVQWTRPCGMLAGTPAITPDGRSLVALTADGTLLSLDPATGAEQWRTPLGAPCHRSPVVGADGSIILRTAAHEVVRVRPDTGEVAYRRKPGQELSDGPLVGPDGTAYVTDYDLNVHALAPNGATRWTYPSRATVTSMAVGSDGVLYLGRDYGRICAVDPKTGQDIWSVLPSMGGALDTERPLLAVEEAPAHRRLVVTCDGGYVYALDARTGGLEWSSRQTRWPRSYPVVLPGGTVAAGAGDHRVYGLDSRTGTLRWEWAQPPQDTPRPIADARGRLFCSSEDGAVHMAEPSLRFEQAAQAAVEAAPVSPPAPHAQVRMEDAWIVVDGVRVPRRRTGSAQS